MKAIEFGQITQNNDH